MMIIILKIKIYTKINIILKKWIKYNPGVVVSKNISNNSILEKINEINH